MMRVAVAAAVLLACASAEPLRAQWAVELARDVSLRIGAPGAVPMAVPRGDSVSFPVPLPVGQPITLELISHGSSSCTSPTSASVTQEDTLVTVVVLDSLRSGVCTMDYVAFPRTVEHVFPEAGEVHLRIVGRARDQVVRLTIGSSGG